MGSLFQHFTPLSEKKFFLKCIDPCWSSWPVIYAVLHPGPSNFPFLGSSHAWQCTVRLCRAVSLPEAQASCQLPCSLWAAKAWGCCERKPVLLPKGKGEWALCITWQEGLCLTKECCWQAPKSSPALVFPESAWHPKLEHEVERDGSCKQDPQVFAGFGGWIIPKGWIFHLSLPDSSSCAPTGASVMLAAWEVLARFLSSPFTPPAKSLAQQWSNLWHSDSGKGKLLQNKITAPGSGTVLFPTPSWEMTTLHSAAPRLLQLSPGSAALADSFPGCPSSAPPAQWAQGAGRMRQRAALAAGTAQQYLAKHLLRFTAYVKILEGVSFMF